MNRPILAVSNLQVTVEDKLVLDGVSFEIAEGEVCLLMGENGSGKSTLAQVLMGDERYKVATNHQTSEPTILFAGEDMLKMSIDERARAGLFVAWQNPVMIPGVSVFNLCRASFEARCGQITKLTDFKARVETLAKKVGLSPEHVGRSVNEGFSGGERKRLELLQLLLVEPKLAVLDEIDSGIDAKGIKMTAKIVEELRERGVSVILITHNKVLLQDVRPDHTWEMRNGQLHTRI